MLSPLAEAISPAPDGCYPAFTTAEGCNALLGLGSGQGNTGIGWYSLFSVGTGNFNTGLGAGTLALNTADSNTATGAGAILLNTTGSNNTANGVDALVFNNTGGQNTAVGAFALFSNTGGNFNTAAGFFALHDNTTGSGLTGYGVSALEQNTSGGFNTALGGNALQANTTGSNNTATGANALFSNTTAGDNTATGAAALGANTTGEENTAIGSGALGSSTTAGANTAIGSGALSSDTTGAGNTVVGFAAGNTTTTGSGNIYIGSQVFGSDSENNTIRIGANQTACYVAGILGETASGGAPVFVTTGGLLGTVTSSARFKTDIKPMGNTSEALFALKPVSFRYKKEIDPANTSQLGLVAEDVEKINPNLVVRDKEGKPYTVRYDQVNAMLLNEFLKEHKTVQELKSIVVRQEAIAAQQQKQIGALTAAVQKVSAQLELNRPTPHTVLNR